MRGDIIIVMKSYELLKVVDFCDRYKLDTIHFIENIGLAKKIIDHRIKNFDSCRDINVGKHDDDDALIKCKVNCPFIKKEIIDNVRKGGLHAWHLNNYSTWKLCGFYYTKLTTCSEELINIVEMIESSSTERNRDA